MVKSIVREHHWSPAIVGDFYLDDIDTDGLEFWFNDLIEYYAELRNKK